MMDIVYNEQKGSSKYFILLIMTDGSITDEDDTINAIIDASELAMSIVIVGVGSHDFADMNKLDGDTSVDSLLTYNGKTASRDIVQFVPVRNFSLDTIAVDLPAAVLQKIPQQFTEYMNKNGFQPLQE